LVGPLHPTLKAWRQWEAPKSHPPIALKLCSRLGDRWLRAERAPRIPESK
jgi:hypothetical protein